VFLKDGQIVSELVYDEGQSLVERRRAVVMTMESLEQLEL
jgi:hypothetical protein